MGKVTGFMEFERVEEGYEPVPERVKHYKEFVIAPDRRRRPRSRARAAWTAASRSATAAARSTTSSRTSTTWSTAATGRTRSTVLHSTNNFPEFTGRICPAPCEAACTLEHQRRSGRHQVDRARDHRHAPGTKAGCVPQPADAQDRQEGRGGRLRPGRPGRRAAARARRPRRDACSRRTTASAACCATASPTSRWRSRTSTAASSR